MTLADYRNTLSWQAAIDLGRSLTMVTEELPVHEDRGLVMNLQRLMVELPSAIAADLISGSNSRMAVVLQLQAALELIDRIYPALDIAESRQQLDSLLERTESSNFAEVKAGPQSEAGEDSEETEVNVDADGTPTPAEDSATEAPAPVSVAVTTEEPTPSGASDASV